MSLSPAGADSTYHCFIDTSAIPASSGRRDERRISLSYVRHEWPTCSYFSDPSRSCRLRVGHPTTSTHSLL
jgi:hypothetical protein